MDITNRTKISIEIACILILLTLNVLVNINGRELSCDKCLVDFISTKGGGSTTINVSLMELYDKFNEGECYIKWEEHNGFYREEKI